MESDSATKRNELYVVTWMNLKNILKKKPQRIQIQKYIYSICYCSVTQLCLTLCDPMQYDSLYIINF